MTTTETTATNLATIHDLEPLLTVDETATYLGISVSALHILRHRGRGPLAIKPTGRALRFRLSDLRSFIAGLDAA
jgi:hypothetical protein